MEKFEINNKGSYCIVEYQQQKIAAFYGDLRHEHAQAFIMMQEDRIRQDPKIKQLEWSDPVVYRPMPGLNGVVHGGKSWRAPTPWGHSYEINSFNKPEGTTYITTWGAKKLGEDAKYLSVAMTIAQLEHEKRIREYLE